MISSKITWAAIGLAMMLLVCGLLGQQVGASRYLPDSTYIGNPGYPAMPRGGIPGCSPQNPNASSCGHQPANPYHRGCSRIDRCRDHGK